MSTSDDSPDQASPAGHRQSVLLLMFAYHFPPENAIGGMRPYRFAKYLSRLGVRSHTFTSADVSARPDLDAETVLDPFIAKPRQGFGWQIERLIRRFLLPGASGSQWALAAYRAACRFLDAQNGHPPAVVFSTYPPLGTPLAGYWLAQRRKLPWILDFRDPMDNPADQYLGPIPQVIYRFLERRFVAAADIVIANTDAAQARLQKSYPHMAGKISLLWNGFDPEQRLQAVPISKRTQRTYSHVGELYGARVISPLLLSLDRLIRQGRLSPGSILIQLTGPAHPDCLPPPSFLTEATKEGWLRLMPEHVPQAEARRIMQESDGLLLVQPGSPLQVPAKLFEYVQIGRPILAYILPDTPIERILRKSGIACALAYASAHEELFDDSVLKFFQLDNQAAKPSEWFETVFNAQHHAEQLLGLMTQLQNGRQSAPANPFATTTVSR